VPTTTVAFERNATGDGAYAALIQLSQHRLAAARAATALNDGSALDVTEHVDALRTYAHEWRRLGPTLAPSAARVYAWRVQLLADTDVREYEMSAPVLETACSTLALVAAHQRRGAVDARGAIDDLPAARRELAWLRAYLDEHVHVPRTNSGRRDPEVLSRVLVGALDAAVAGQMAVKRGIAAMQDGSSSASSMASTLFESTRLFQTAVDVLPTYAAFTSARTSTSALAHRYTAQALLDAVEVGALQESARGVAVTLARRAHDIDPRNEAVRRYVDEIEARNRLEFGMQSVPTTATVLVTVTAAVASVTATSTASGWHVAVPVASRVVE
jgi:hypothetical protein